MLPTFEKSTFCKGLCGENDRPSIKGKRREKYIVKLCMIRRELSLNALQINQKSYQPFHRAIDETLRIGE